MRGSMLRLTELTRCAALAAALFCGPLTAHVFAEPRRTGADGRAIFDACAAALSSLTDADVRVRLHDPSFRGLVSTAHTRVLEAMSASAGTVWPAELARERKLIDRMLAAAAAPLAKGERPRVETRYGVALTWVNTAKRRLARASTLLQEVVPPALVPDPISNANPAPATPIPAPAGALDFTWTNLVPSADSRIVYVSSSEGNNANDGLSPEHPKANWWGSSGAQALMRAGYPDWMLLKRGDTWTLTDPDQITNNYLKLEGGRSTSEPMVLWSYGSSTVRPKILNTQIRVSQGGISLIAAHVAIVGIHMERATESGSYAAAIDIVPNRGSDFLVEDCLVEKYGLGIHADPDASQRLTDLRIRGCVIVDSYSTVGHSQGMLLGNTDGIVVEGCVLDHNGWSATIYGAGSTIYNHNVYIHPNCSDVIFRQNISARASAQGMPAGIAKLNEDNLYLSNPFSCVAFNSAPASMVRHNVFIDGGNVRGRFMDDSPEEAQGGGIAMTIGFSAGYPSHTVEIYDNIFANQVSGRSPWVLQPSGPISGLSIHDNIAYKWDLFLRPGDNGMSWSGTNSVANNVVEIGTTNGGLLFYDAYSIDPSWHFAGNQWYSGAATPWWIVGGSYVNSSTAWIAATGETGGIYTKPSFPDPTRSPGSYNATLGGTATLEAFLTEARKQSRLNWRSAYTSRQANNYFREGFGRASR